MSSPSLSLFLGFCVTREFSAALDQVNPGLKTLLLEGGEHYLQEHQMADARYLGKNLGEMTDLTELELVEKNIYSLLQRLVPSFPVEEYPLTLLIPQ